jgi:molecular chaperone GrpE
MNEPEETAGGPLDERGPGAATDTARPPGAGGEPGEGPEEAPDEVQDLRRQVEERQDQLMRALAEMDNLRRRARREREEYTRYALEALLRDLVPVLDNFDRALEAARGAPGSASIVQGVELIQRELLRVLERAGLTRYSALGHRFDPTRHEATARVVSTDQAPDTVVHEIVPGYLLHDRVLRAAQVAVAVAPDEDAA